MTRVGAPAWVSALLSHVFAATDAYFCRQAACDRNRTGRYETCARRLSLLWCICALELHVYYGMRVFVPDPAHLIFMRWPWDAGPGASPCEKMRTSEKFAAYLKSAYTMGGSVSSTEGFCVRGITPKINPLTLCQATNSALQAPIRHTQSPNSPKPLGAEIKLWEGGPFQFQALLQTH